MITEHFKEQMLALFYDISIPSSEFNYRFESICQQYGVDPFDDAIEQILTEDIDRLKKEQESIELEIDNLNAEILLLNDGLKQLKKKKVD